MVVRWICRQSVSIVCPSPVSTYNFLAQGNDEHRGNRVRLVGKILQASSLSMMPPSVGLGRNDSDSPLPIRCGCFHMVPRLTLRNEEQQQARDGRSGLPVHQCIAHRVRTPFTRTKSEVNGFVKLWQGFMSLMIRAIFGEECDSTPSAVLGDILHNLTPCVVEKQGISVPGVCYSSGRISPIVVSVVAVAVMIDHTRISVFLLRLLIQTPYS